MKEKLLNIDQTESDRTIGETLAEILGMQTKGNVVKIFGWYQTLKEGKDLMLDEADKDLLKSIIEGDERVFIYVKGQILKAMKN